MIKSTFDTRRQGILLQIYKALVWPHLEFCTPALSPLCKKDAQLMEKVQHRFTWLIPELKSLSHNWRLTHLGITTLEEHRNHADRLEMFNMYCGLSSLPFNRFFQLNTVLRTHGHSAKVTKQRCLTTVMQHFFSDRVIIHWNVLTDDNISASSLSQFRRRLQKFCRIKKAFPLRLGACSPCWLNWLIQGRVQFGFC
jgi:ribonucleases P/MRP protein subunit RPP40